jgi:hypothetical protein
MSVPVPTHHCPWCRRALDVCRAQPCIFRRNGADALLPTPIATFFRVVTPEMSMPEPADTHVCACVACNPSLALDGPRQRPDHIAVRFGTFLKAGQPYWETALDGSIVDQVVEALPGEDGHVLRYTVDPGARTAHLCRTCAPPHAGRFAPAPGVRDGAGACLTLDHGRVVTWLVPAEEWDVDTEVRHRNALRYMPGAHRVRYGDPSLLPADHP